MVAPEGAHGWRQRVTPANMALSAEPDAVEESRGRRWDVGLGIAADAMLRPREVYGNRWQDQVRRS
jgi:hypothetical protein